MQDNKAVLRTSVLAVSTRDPTATLVLTILRVSPLQRKFDQAIGARRIADERYLQIRWCMIDHI